LIFFVSGLELVGAQFICLFALLGIAAGAILLHAQGAADVQKPEDLLHRLQQLQQDTLVQNERLAQATAAADSLQGGLLCSWHSTARVLLANCLVKHQPKVMVAAAVW
jgi:multidrug resistance efflux pump